MTWRDWRRGVSDTQRNVVRGAMVDRVACEIIECSHPTLLTSLPSFQDTYLGSIPQADLLKVGRFSVPSIWHMFPYSDIVSLRDSDYSYITIVVPPCRSSVLSLH